jgi:hypothetical protein
MMMIEARKLRRARTKPTSISGRRERGGTKETSLSTTIARFKGKRKGREKKAMQEANYPPPAQDISNRTLQ